MINVAALTANKVDPCSRFRFRQFIKPLAALDIKVSEHYLPMTRYRRQPLASIAMALRIPGVIASRSADITWFRRELIPERVTLERFTGGPRVFDVDDAIWMLSKSDFSERIVDQCDAVIAGNAMLAEHYGKFGKPVWIVPTSIDTNAWSPASQQPKQAWNIGWIGTNSNLRFLESIEEPLVAFLNDHSDAILTVVCDKRPKFNLMPHDRWRFVKWSPENEIELVRGMGVGLMPLDDSHWSRGKCGFKMIQYMSVGKPVVVSPFGVNKEILEMGNVGFGAISNSDWYDSLRMLYEDQHLSDEMGVAGRSVIERHFSVRTNVVKIAEVFRTVAAR